MENPKITFKNGSEIEILKPNNNYVRGKRSQIINIFDDLSEEDMIEILHILEDEQWD